MLGSLAHFDETERVALADMPELERLMLHRLAELDPVIRQAYRDFDYKRVFQTLFNFATVDLSAFYFDIRKDALYCDPISSARRKACLTVLDHLFECLVTWLAPILSFTMEETWLSRYPESEGSVHAETFRDVPSEWRNDTLAARWQKVRQVRRVITGALEIERAAKTIGSSLEAAPIVHIADAGLLAAVQDRDMADIAITSDLTIVEGDGPANAFRMEEVPGVAIEFARATGNKCARSWKISAEVGADPDYPDITLRDAQAMRERAAAGLDG
jgi:isoleucyl-tRNA synthetase